MVASKKLLLIIVEIIFNILNKFKKIKIKNFYKNFRMS